MTVATSSGESEFIEMYDAATQGLGMETVMAEIGLSPQLKMIRNFDELIDCEVFCGDRGLGKMRHLEVKFLWLREIVQMGKMRVDQVRSATNIADSDHVPRQSMSSHGSANVCSWTSSNCLLPDL